MSNLITSMCDDCKYVKYSFDGGSTKCGYRGKKDCNFIPREKKDLAKYKVRNKKDARDLFADCTEQLKKAKADIERLLQKLQQAKSETIKLPHKVTAEVYSVLDREEFPKGVYKCEVSAYLIDGDDELYSLLTATVGDRTIVGIKTDIENMYATRGEAEKALREKKKGANK